MSTRKGIVIQVKNSNDNVEPPIIMDFQNGQLNTNCIENSKFCIAYNKEAKNKNALLAVDKNLYEGVIGRGYPEELINTYIAIKNKRLKTVRFIQTRQVSMSNILNRTIDENNLNKNRYSSDDAFKKYVRSFGGRKSCTILERNERMKVNLNIVKNQLNNTVANFDINNGGDGNNESTIEIKLEEDIIPPFNKEANQITNIYDIKELIPQTLLDRMNEEANEVYSTTEELPIQSKYVLEQIFHMRKMSKNAVNTLTNIKVLLYMDGLYGLIKTRSRILTKANLSNISEKIENDIRVRFSPKNALNPTKTPFSTDKAMCYFIVLAILMAPDMQIDINVITKEFSKTRKKILQYCNLINVILKTRQSYLTFDLPRNMKSLIPMSSSKSKFNKK